MGQKLYVHAVRRAAAQRLPVCRASPDDFAVPRIDRREIFIVAYRKPDGSYLADGLLHDRKSGSKGGAGDTRNWNTILKAIA